MTSSMLPAAVFGARVRSGAAPRSLVDPVFETPTLVVGRHEALVRVDGVARFHVRHGREVIVDIEAGATEAQCLLWLHGRIANVVLSQQGRHALHASTVAVGSQAVAIAGMSGAGKSTTVVALVDAGAILVADEVSAVDVVGNRAVVAPLSRAVRLAPATADRLRVATVVGSSAADPMGKATAVMDRATNQPAPLSLIVVLRADAGQQGVTVERLDHLAGVRALQGHTYGQNLVALQPNRHLRWAADVASCVPVYRLARPAKEWTIDAVMANIRLLLASNG